MKTGFRSQVSGVREVKGCMETMMGSREWAVLFRMYSPEQCNYQKMLERGLSPREVVAEFDRGHSIAVLADRIHRTGAFAAKQYAADYVRKCVYDDLAVSINHRDSGEKL